MASDYQQYKESVLSIYNAFLPVVEEIKDGNPTNYDNTLAFLETRYENLLKDRFLLVIAGEAKSGKSTFINAYLGKEILPMDVKQCTSCIVEVKYGEKYTLRATFIDGREELYDSEEAIYEFLQRNAAMDDNYRDIPIAIINMNLIGIKKDTEITDVEIARITKSLMSENLYHLEPNVYAEKIKQYIREKQPEWRNIVEKIEICYPFEDEDMRGIEIIDTPGVNAEGQLGRITDDYMVNANAVMFLKPLPGAAMEASSFRKFLESRSAGRSKGAKFLILTRSTNVTDVEAKRLYSEALKQYPDINSKQIIPVDSKAELYWNLFNGMTTEEIEEYIDREDEAERLEAFVAKAWDRKAHGDRDKFLKVMKDISHFDYVDDALNLFARKAQYIALSEFLEHIQIVIDKIIANLEENITNRKLKLSDPIELERKLARAKNDINALKYKLHVTVEGIFSKYCDTEGVINTEADKVIDEYLKEMNAIDPHSSNSLNELEKLSFGKIDFFTYFETSLQKAVVAECDASLIEYSKDANIKYDTFKPNLTPEDVTRMKQRLREQNTKIRDIEKGITFAKRTEHVTEFHQKEFYASFKNSIESRIKTIKNEVVKSLIEFVRGVTNMYSDELVRNLDILTSMYKQLQDEEKSTKEQIAIIEHLEAVLTQIKTIDGNVRECKEGVDRNV